VIVADLRELLVSLREHGVTSYEHEGIKLTLGPPPPAKPNLADDEKMLAAFRERFMYGSESPR